MSGSHLKDARLRAGWTQTRAAKRLGVTQAYLSMLERGVRPVSEAVARRAAKHLPVSPEALPFTGKHPEHFEDALGALGYPGFAYLRNGKRMNPAELLLLALDTDQLPARAVEGLPWVPLAFPDLDWEWLLREAKLRNRQNRLGYVLELSREVSVHLNYSDLVKTLAHPLAKLRTAQLLPGDSLCQESMTNAERSWLLTHSTATAVSWGLLSDLQLGDLTHVHR